jgi:osmoprotectant transport system ATP-binding protein
VSHRGARLRQSGCLDTLTASIPPVAGDATASGPRLSRSAASVEYRGATKRYPGQAEPAIKDLSLVVPAGEICVLVGPSGCGKTTALRLANRMIELTSGDILLDGESIRRHSPAQLRRGIGYVIQQIGLFPHLTVGDNIATVPRLLGWERKRIERRVEDLLELVSLPREMRNRYPAQLSGGQRQRVGVARALAADPPLMLMDEPFGAVDPINRERLQNQFLRLQSEIKKTILFVTHDIDEAIKMGDRVAVLEKGGVLAQYATPPELLMSPANDFVEDFVGADRALKRLSLLRVKDVDLWKAPLVRVGEPTAAARAAIAEADLPHPLVVDDQGRPLGWLSERDLAGETVPATPDAAPYPIVELDDVLRDALSHLLQSETLYGPVVDEHGRVAGVLSVAVISDFLASNEATELATAPAERVTG